MNKAGFEGSIRPDVVGKARFGKSLSVEVVSKSQTSAQMNAKLSKLIGTDSTIAKKVISWAANVTKWLF